MGGRPTGPPGREHHGIFVPVDGVRAAGGVGVHASNGCCGGGRPMGCRLCGGVASGIFAGSAAQRTGSTFYPFPEPTCRTLLAFAYRSALPMVTLTARRPSPIFCESATNSSKVVHVRSASSAWACTEGWSPFRNRYRSCPGSYGPMLWRPSRINR